MGNANRIVYIEPNSLPAKYAAKASPDVRLDNITWAPEDLNISVDLQVVIPSRTYRESDKNSDIDVNSNFDVFNKLNKYQSILSGVELKPNASFLTDDYTTMSYQEIKNNKSGSKEMLGINSIGIDFDSHLYPKVRMNFTDVRGTSLMMPQEQYVYDINSQAATGQEVEESAVCKNFFQSFFKFPYPRFLLSVKGIYGTCVTFVLSVEDFKATFNSDTGNFDVVVTFIGNMYGLYTDIPMNYLIIAPYIGGRNGQVNEYWKKNTENGGAFFYNEDGANGEPIQTYVEFRHSFKNFSDDTNGGAVFGANMAQIARKQKTVRYIKMLQAQIRELPKNLDTPTICYNLGDGSNGHILFKIEENGDSNFIVNEDYVKTFQKIYEEDDEVEKLVEKPEEGTVFSYLTKGKNVIAGETFKDNIINDKGVYSLSPSEGSYLSNDINEFNSFINGKDAADAEKIRMATDILYYDEKFLNALSSAENELENEIESLSNAASQETIDIFRNHFRFTPTIENVMRMLFAHLDTFIHKFYELIRKIQPDRTLSKIGCKKENTDIQAPGNDAFVPPFTAFFSSKNGKRVYPTDAGAFIEEVNFVESMFNGMEERLTSEAALEAQRRLKASNAPKSTVPNSVKVKFSPIAVTDIFYNGVNPYDFLNTADEITVYDLIYFFICRFYLGIRGYEREKYNSKKAIVEAIINKELENLKNSSLWGTLAKKPNFRNELDSIDYEKIGNVVGASASVSRSEIFKVTYAESGYKIEKRDSENSEFYKFNGITQLISSTAPTRKDIEGFDCIVKDKPNGREYNENDIKEFQKAYTIPSKEAEKKFSAVKTDNPVCPYRNDTLAGNLIDLITRKPSNGYASLIQPLKDGTPVVLKTEAGSEKKAKSYEKGKNEEIVIFDDGQIWMPEGNVWKHNCKAQDLLNNNKNTSDNLWIPIALFHSNKGNMINLFSEMCKKNSKVFFSGDIYQKAAMFLTALQDACGFKIDYLNSGTTDGIYIIPSVLKYLFGGYQYLINTADQTFVHDIEGRVKGIKSFKDAISNDFVWDFTEWAEGTFSRIEVEVAQDLAKEEDYYEVKRKNYYSNADQTFKALSPSTPLQTTLLALLREKSCVSLFTNALEEGTVLEENIDRAYVSQFVDAVIDALPVNPTIETITDLELSEGSLSIDKSQKDSLYYTLKNLYDRWLSTYTSNTFRLKSVPEERRAKEKKMEDDEKGNSNTAITTSEFDNFLYVDSFYNDISKDFFVNPSTLFDIVNSQIVGDSNYNVYEFIARICEKNKLLLQCLPVYNNLYSQKTFEEIFKPHSLYYGPERIHRRLGNTYLIMYTYEQSHHLNLAQDKTNDVSFSNDGFDIADIYGEITPDAMELFPQSSDKKNYNICAFGVTPGAQNQSYFTKVSVGMDNPRITDFAIKNLFQLSSMAKNGRAEGVGVGQDMYSIYSNRAYDCRVEMMGCANIMPMMYFQLNNVPMFRGTYMIKKVEHHIQNNTMTTTFTGTRMSRRHIPFNQAIFNVEALVSALEGVDKNKDSYVTIGVQRVKVHSNDTVERVTNESAEISQPVANYDNSREFNVWAAINQMYQVLYTVEEGKTFRPLIDRKEAGDPSPAICATAVELFLMAGFNGLFPANNKQQAVVINGYRGKAEVAVNGVKFEGENGYNMKNKLAALGFACIAAGASAVTEMQKNHRLQECDVCVMKPPKNHSTQYGHVCMWAGDENPKWISDYMQVNSDNATYWWPYKVPYKDAGLEKNDVLLYRYTGKKISETKLYGSWDNGTFVPGRDNTNGTDTVPTEQV